MSSYEGLKEKVREILENQSNKNNQILKEGEIEAAINRMCGFLQNEEYAILFQHQPARVVAG